METTRKNRGAVGSSSRKVLNEECSTEENQLQIRELTKESDSFRGELKKSQSKETSQALQIKQLPGACSRLQSDLTSSTQENEKISSCLTDEMCRSRTLQKNYDKLEDVSSSLKKCLEELGHAVKTSYEAEILLKTEKCQLQKELDIQQQNSQVTRSLLNKETLLRIKAEKKCEMLESDLQSLKARNCVLASQVTEYRALAKKLDQVSTPSTSCSKRLISVNTTEQISSKGPVPCSRGNTDVPYRCPYNIWSDSSLESLSEDVNCFNNLTKPKSDSFAPSPQILTSDKPQERTIWECFSFEDEQVEENVTINDSLPEPHFNSNHIENRVKRSRGQNLKTETAAKKEGSTLLRATGKRKSENSITPVETEVKRPLKNPEASPPLDARRRRRTAAKD